MSPALGGRIFTTGSTWEVMFATALFTVAEAWKQPKHSCPDERISKTWCRHTYSGRLLSLRKGILTRAVTWMKLEDIMLSDKSQSQKRQVLYKFWKRWEYQTTWPASWETYMQVRKQQLELDMEQQTGSKQEKEYVKAVYCHPAYLTSMQSTSWETLGWMKHMLESRLLGEISIITSDTQMTPPCKESQRGHKESDMTEQLNWTDKPV